MFGKLIEKLYIIHMKEKQKKAKIKKEKEIGKYKVEMYGNLKNLYHFANWLRTKGFQNRKARKIFWNRVINNEPVLENVLNDLILRYEIDKKTEVKRKKVKNSLPEVKNKLNAPKMKKPKE